MPRNEAKHGRVLAMQTRLLLLQGTPRGRLEATQKGVCGTCLEQKKKRKKNKRGKEEEEEEKKKTVVELKLSYSMSI